MFSWIPGKMCGPDVLAEGRATWAAQARERRLSEEPNPQTASLVAVQEAETGCPSQSEQA